MAQQVKNHFNTFHVHDVHDEDFSFAHVKGHHIVEGTLELEVEYSSGVDEFHLIMLLEKDDPYAVPEYILNMELGQTLHPGLPS